MMDLHPQALNSVLYQKALFILPKAKVRIPIRAERQLIAGQDDTMQHTAI